MGILVPVHENTQLSHNSLCWLRGRIRCSQDEPKVLLPRLLCACSFRYTWGSKMIAHQHPKVSDAMASPDRFTHELHAIKVGDILTRLVADDLLPAKAASEIYTRHVLSPVYQPRQLLATTTG